MNNANDYSAEYLDRTIALMDLNERDLVFITSYLFLQKRWNVEACIDFFERLKTRKAKIVLDLARSSFIVRNESERRPFKAEELLQSMAGVKPHMVTGDFEIFLDLTGRRKIYDKPSVGQYGLFLRKFNTTYINCRYKSGDHVYEDTYRLDEEGNPAPVFLEVELKRETLPWPDRRGFGDVATADTLKRILKKESCGV